MDRNDPERLAALYAECLRQFYAQEPAATHPEPQTPEHEKLRPQDRVIDDIAKMAESVLAEVRRKHRPPKYPPLSEIVTDFLGTEQAAYYLNRRGQTLRWWHHMGNGPVRAVRRNGRLAWPVDGIRRYLRTGSAG